MTKNKDSTRYFSSKQEEYVAKLINGRTVSNSGAAKFTCGDVVSDEFIIECKTKMKSSGADKNMEMEFMLINTLTVKK